MKEEKIETKCTFWELLYKYNIEIPKIQRDYAQGRKDLPIIKLVKTFLDDIKKAIKYNKELNLDFVYGKVDEGILIPLDGQQRLTTLFLIHWYIALKENRLTEIKDRLSKFTYETRVSSSDFCKNLVLNNIDYNPKSETISDTISDSAWYFLSWELDPTVSAMLKMLDRIHEKFKDIKDPLFEKLKTNITFHFLPLKKFKLTDELYIKMNARGKLLTDFENFKAKFSPYLDTLDKSKLDNEWLDIFWKLESPSEIEPENVDKNFFNFFKNITLNFFAETNNDDNRLDSYDLFDIYSGIYKKDEYVYVEQIIEVFNGLTPYVDEKEIFKKFLSSSVNYWERLRFYSLSRFFIKYKQVNNDNKTILERWMRVTQNLINNTLIQSPINYKNAIKSIKKLSENISDIYNYVKDSSDKIEGFLKIQIKEEGLKAKLILEDSKWENIFVNIEKHPYFDGQIEFILKYSDKDKDNNYNKELFEDYSIKLSKLFGSELGEKHGFLFQRALLTKGNYLVDIGQNKTFCKFDKALRAKNDNWRKVFNDEKKTSYLKKLLDNINKDNIINSLESIIKNHNVTDWRKLIIKEPLNISDCGERQIRQYQDWEKIYLLSKTQMNSYHIEIHSRDLFLRKFKSDYKPFNKIEYWQSTSFWEPCIALLGFNYSGSKFGIKITFNSNHNYNLCFMKLDKDNSCSIIKDHLGELGELGFKEDSITLKENELVGKIKEICTKLIQIKTTSETF